MPVQQGLAPGGPRNRRAVIGAVLWMLCLQYFVAEALAIHAWQGIYSLKNNFISDLGASACFGPKPACWTSPLARLMNASFVLQGILIMAGAWLTSVRMPASAGFRAAMVLVGLSGVGVLIVGFAPEDSLPKAHYLGAAENLIFCNLGMTTFGLASFGLARVGGDWFPRWVASISLAFGLLGLGGLIAMALNIYPVLEPGGVERIAAYPFPLWLCLMGATLLATNAGAPQAAATTS